MIWPSLWLAAAASSHPIHSSSAEIVQAAGSELASIRLRAFADDFPPGVRADLAAPYLREHFRILARDGRVVSLTVDSLRVDGPVVLVSLSGRIPGGLPGTRVWHGVLTERFADQVNIVVLRYGDRSLRLLFVPGDSAKPVP